MGAWCTICLLAGALEFILLLCEHKNSTTAITSELLIGSTTFEMIR